MPLTVLYGQDTVGPIQRLILRFDIALEFWSTYTYFFVLAINHRVTTKNLGAFKNALDAIDVHGGGDCPEMCMTGIEKALIESRPRSLLYIFTDASAKDYEKYEKVKALAQSNLDQVIFSI